MTPFILTVVYVIFLIIAILVIIKKRKKMNVKAGFKSYVSSLCWFVISVIVFTSALSGKHGSILNWSMITILLVVSIYFSRYLPRTNKKSRERS